MKALALSVARTANRLPGRFYSWFPMPRKAAIGMLAVVWATAGIATYGAVPHVAALAKGLVAAQLHASLR